VGGPAGPHLGRDGSFAEHDGQTTVRGLTRFATVEDRDGMPHSGMESGAAESYNQLDKYLATIA
jgi:hypothetical protein